MFIDQWSRVVAASVTPVVVISATALLCLALYNRLAAIVSRLRAVQRERLSAQERLDSLSPADIEAGAALRQSCILEGLAEQSAHIRSRARLIRGTLTLLLSAIASLVFCSLLNGLTILWPQAMYGAAIFFVIGMLLLLGAIGFALAEILIALDPVEFEADMVSELTGDLPPENGSARGHARAHGPLQSSIRALDAERIHRTDAENAGKATG